MGDLTLGWRLQSNLWATNVAGVPDQRRTDLGNITGGLGRWSPAI
jgi:hypothetical protein